VFLAALDEALRILINTSRPRRLEGFDLLFGGKRIREAPGEIVKRENKM